MENKDWTRNTSNLDESFKSKGALKKAVYDRLGCRKSNEYTPYNKFIVPLFEDDGRIIGFETIQSLSACLDERKALAKKMFNCMVKSGLDPVVVKEFVFDSVSDRLFSFDNEVMKSMFAFLIEFNNEVLITTHRLLFVVTHEDVQGENIHFHIFTMRI